VGVKQRNRQVWMQSAKGRRERKIDKFANAKRCRTPALMHSSMVYVYLYICHMIYDLSRFNSSEGVFRCRPRSQTVVVGSPLVPSFQKMAPELEDRMTVEK
jgi:hypothetical protein